MKKSLSLLLAVMLMMAAVPAFAAITAPADIDFSGMSFDELVDLKRQIDLALWDTDEWQSVEVPSGMYVVGEDISAGHWAISVPKGASATLKWGDVLDESGRDLAYSGKIYEYEYMKDPEFRYYEAGDKSQVDYDLKDGQFIIVDSGLVIFSPFTGKPSLGFK